MNLEADSMIYNTFGKRILDILIVLAGLIILSPVMILIALLVRIVLGTPVLFRQKRPGLHGKLFLMYKFRTMNDCRDNTGELLPDEQRLPLFGRFLRSTSLDELPELFNILKGDMSLIGPRPLLERYLNRYTPEQMRRHNVKPGLTGWAQVNGRNAITWQERFSLDVWYVDNLSFILDMKIIFLTFGAILGRKGISQPGRATIDEFMGNN